MNPIDKVNIETSVVCPFFNEAEIIEDAVTTLLYKMEELGTTWELIVVDDGSTDSSRDIVLRLSKSFPQLRLLGYTHNKGRGYALRTGIAAARGDVIITTEIDLSWGEDIIERLYRAMKSDPSADFVVASPHLKGGGYKNVPWKRVFMSRLGNRIIRTFMVNAATMNTGMTRAYKREMIQSIPLEEDGKEFHLEVILKAHSLGYRSYEIPCVLEWKTYKRHGNKIRRQSSSKVKRLVVSHSLFSLFGNPIRYVWGLSAMSMLLSFAFIVWSVIRLYLGLVSVFTLIISLSLAIISVMLFGLGIIAQQGNMVQRELWTLKRDLLHMKQRTDIDNNMLDHDLNLRQSSNR